MKLFEKTRLTVDERIENTLNKLYKEAYSLVMFLCTVSIIAKFIIYGTKVELVATELVIIIIPSLYFLIRTVFLGIYSDVTEIQNRTRKTPSVVKNVIIGIAFGLGIAIFFGVRSAVLYANTTGLRIWYFTLVFFVSVMIYIPIFVAIVVFPDMLLNKISKKQTSNDK